MKNKFLVGLSIAACTLTLFASCQKESLAPAATGVPVWQTTAASTNANARMKPLQADNVVVAYSEDSGAKQIDQAAKNVVPAAQKAE